MSIRLRLTNPYLKITEKRKLARSRDMSKTRADFEKTARRFFQPGFTRYTNSRLCHGDRHIPVLWAETKAGAKDGVILYVHGGAYFMGSPHTHKRMLAVLADKTGFEAVLPDYGLAPENPFPQGFEDIVASYHALLNQGYPPEKIALGGDSAGGGLVLALLSHICTQDLPRPACCFALSPWTDLTLSGGTLQSNASTDVILPGPRIEQARNEYLCGADPQDARASPVFADFPGCPPVLIHTSSSEILLDDAMRICARLEQNRVDVLCRTWDNAPHVWHIMWGYFPEADQALTDVADFITAKCCAGKGRQNIV